MKIILIILSMLIFPGAVSGLGSALIRLISFESIFYPLLIGILIGLILYLFFIKKYDAITTFDHELAHAIVAILFLRRIKRFVSTSSGGYVRHSGGIGGELGNVLISLAPYYFPTFSLITIFIRPIIPLDWFPWYDGFIGGMLGYHFASSIEDIIQSYRSTEFIDVFNQPAYSDIKKVGLISSAFILTALIFLIYGAMLHLLIGGYKYTFQYIESIYINAKNICIHFYFLIYNLIITLL